MSSPMIVTLTADELAALVRRVVDDALAARTAAANDAPSEWIDTSVAASILGVSTRQIAKLAKAGDLPHSNVGRLLRFRRSDVLAVLERR